VLGTSLIAGLPRPGNALAVLSESGLELRSGQLILGRVALAGLLEQVTWMIR
jgi:hypothetical protein